MTIMKYLRYIGRGVLEGLHKIADAYERHLSREFIRQHSAGLVRIESANGDQSYRPVRDNEIGGISESLDTRL